MLKNNYRNIGICAHIDAGKTSLTERILYFTGKKQYIGEVYNGESEMDWMDQEKERGITITSAVTTVFWSGMFNDLSKYKINIIDTPGHIDFTAEVERSLRILDGICVVFCAVGGVQPQTKIIWNQINKYKIPRIILINKLDRIGSNYDLVCNQILSSLKSMPIIIHKPYYVDGIFTGLIDLLVLKRYLYINDSIIVDNNYIPSSNDYINQKNIYELLSNYDDVYLDKYLNNKFSFKDTIDVIRKYTLSCKIVPVLCGSVLKNKGVHNFLDAIINFLPSPIDVISNYKNKMLTIINNNKFSALVFKVLNDEYSSKIVFIRIYSGLLTKGDNVFNYNKKTSSRVIKILEIHAKNKTEIDFAVSGDIIAIIGLKIVDTGDTLCDKDFPVKLETIKFPKPVISISVSPIKFSDTNKFYDFIKKIALEDPTIKLSIDCKSNNMIISGMGELHLDVFLERVKRLSGIIFKKSNPSVTYKETITKSVYNSIGKYIKQSGGKGQYGHVVLNAYPNNLNDDIIIISKIKGGIIPLEYINIIKNTILDVCSDGFLVGGKIISIKFEIIDGSFHEVDSNELAFKMATKLATKYIFSNGSVIVLEPIMKVYIFSNQEYIGSLTSLILSKRGLILKVSNISSNLIKITSFIPMIELFNFSTILRSKTKGSSNFFMEFNSYKRVNNTVLNNIINNDN